MWYLQLTHDFLQVNVVKRLFIFFLIDIKTKCLIGYVKNCKGILILAQQPFVGQALPVPLVGLTFNDFLDYPP